MATTTPETLFSRDVLGRYVCNTFSEAKQSGPFDVIIIGGGTFGLALAQDLFDRGRSGGMTPIKPPNYRILVLEGGPLAFREHVQDIPNLQIASPSVIAADPITLLDAPRAFSPSSPLPATRQELLSFGLDAQPLLENWGLAWNSSIRFGGLAYCLGGRSLYFGGWSPRYLDSEMEITPTDPLKGNSPWPATVVEDLKARFFLEAARQTGVTTSNDFIYGSLHNYYRKRLFDIYSTIPNGVPLSELPDYTVEAPEDIGGRLQALLDNPPYPKFQESVKLDAPLAVQITSRPGFFPFNKFSSMPLATTAARQAYADSSGDNTRKRLMIVPNCHVKGLRTRPYTLATGATVLEINGIDVRARDTGDDFLDLSGTIVGNPNRRPVVVLAMGAIESARMAQLVPGVASMPNGAVIGSSLMVHLRKNVQFTVPSLPPGLTLKDLELTALLVRCRTKIRGTPVHFHFQISAAALPTGSGAGASDALLFQNVPDLDNFNHFADTAPGEVDVSIRAVGEILPNPQNTVTVPPPGQQDIDEAGVPRAIVILKPRTAPGGFEGDIDLQVVNQMDQVIDHLATNLFQVPPNNYAGAAKKAPDGLGTTYHESGTLRTGDDPARSVVNADGQFHFVTNLYAGDAAVLPTCGSANPVMNGVALRRRLAKRLIPEGDGGAPPHPFAKYVPAPLTAGTVLTLFDGKSLAGWRMAGRGTFHVIDGALQSVPSFDLGLLWSTTPMPKNYRLELEFLARTFETNSGVFIRFTHPEGFTNPDKTVFANTAWSAVFSGFEVQIDNTGAGQPIPGLAKHTTGAVYAVNYPADPNSDTTFPNATPGDFVSPKDAQVGGWNAYQIDVVNDVITVVLNGAPTARFTIPVTSAGNSWPVPYAANRGRFSPTEPTFIGLQSYSNYSFTTGFRNIKMTVL